jgi:PPM family protein phosphatase
MRKTEIMSDTSSPVIESNGTSVVGPVREDNQDSILLPEALPPSPHGLLFAVADGMGGYAHGQMASSMALEKLTEEFSNGHAKPEKALARGVESANLSVYQAAQRLGAGRMGTTLTATSITGSTLHIVHVGDSRAYLVRGKQISLLTSDHTMVGDMVRMRIIPPEKIRTHAQRSILTRGVGLSLFVQPDISHIQLQMGDRLILCSDGLWSAIQDEELGALAHSAASASELSQNLIDLAIDHETDDNVSVISIFIHALSVPAVPGNNSKKFSFRNLFHGKSLQFKSIPVQPS